MSVTDLQQQQSMGFRQLRFMPALEARYREHRDRALRERCRPVTASALIILLFYVGLDLAMLPPELAAETVAVRTLFTCPVITLVWWLSYRPLRAHTFILWYAGAYLACGLSVVVIIALARLRNYPMPYDGILMILMFGYVVMGLPFRTVTIASAMFIAIYLAMELVSGTPVNALVINGFFIATANVIGMVGSWLSDYRQRAHFLDQQLLQASRRQAERENDRKTHLITVASHDLRQPLNVIGLMLENLASADPSATRAPLIGRLKRSVSHLNSLLASVLDISRLQEGMVAPHPTALSARDALEQAIDAVADEADDRGVSLTIRDCSLETGVWADPQLLQRILLNLVMNSLEHSGAGEIRLRALDTDAQTRFEVDDNGCGIDEATLARVFEPFFQAQAQPRDNPGLGLGLAIVRELTSLMGGHCGVHRNAGGGSCFWVTLPTARAPAPMPLPGLDAAPACGRLLVVEDHDEARFWICQILQSWGYQTADFAEPDAALAYARQTPVDLLISDLHLPGQDGHALFRQLASRPGFRGGIIMTADTTSPQAFDAEQRLWTLHKPLAPLRLHAALLQLTRLPASLEPA